jgi:hypothetical protein
MPYRGKRCWNATTLRAPAVGDAHLEALLAPPGVGSEGARFILGICGI